MFRVATYTALPLALSFKYLRNKEKKLSISVSKSYDVPVSIGSNPTS